MKRRICVTALGFMALVSSAAYAHDGGSISHKNNYLRAKVVRVTGDPMAPGCDLVRHKCPKGTTTTVRAYFTTLRRMIAPPLRMVVATSSNTAATPPNVSVGVGAYNTAGGSSAERFAGCESGGSWTAVNPSTGAYGRYQILPSHWTNGQCQGLGRDPAGQSECADRIMATEGSHAWAQCGG